MYCVVIWCNALVRGGGGSVCLGVAGHRIIIYEVVRVWCVSGDGCGAVAA